jgi:hypothetical protein
MERPVIVGLRMRVVRLDDDGKPIPHTGFSIPPEPVPEGRVHQCRCVVDDGVGTEQGRCRNDAPLDSPFCDTCEDRHEGSRIPTAHVDLTGRVVPG